MDTTDQITNTTPSGHEGYLCHRCGWPFPNPQPSAKHRRAHKKICGTIDGYTNLIASEVGSVSDDDKEKTPSPKIEKKSGDGSGGGGGMRVSFSRSEDELFSDAVTEFSDSGSASKTLDKDLFFSFKDAENDEISKVDTSVEVSKKIDTHVEESGETEIATVCDSSESKPELTETGFVKDGVMGHAPEPSHISHSQETKSIDVGVAGEEKVQEGQTYETSTQEAKDSGLTEASPEVSVIVGGDHDNIKQGNFDKLEPAIADGISEDIKQEQKIKSDAEHVSEVVNDYKTAEETTIEKFGLEYEISQVNVKQSETDHLEGVAEEIMLEKFESDHKHAPEAAKEPAAVQNVSVLTEKEDFGAPNVPIQEVSKEPVTVLTEKEDLEAHELEKSSIEQIQEVVKEPSTVLTEQEDLRGSHLEKQSNEHTYEVFENPIPVLTEKQDLGAPELENNPKEPIQEVVKQPDTVLTEKEDLGGARLEEQSNKHNHEVVEKPDSALTESQDMGAPELEKCSKEHVEEPNLVLMKKEDLGEPKSEKCSKDEVIEQYVDNAYGVTDASVDDSVVKGKNASDVHVPIVEEAKINNQDSGAALSVVSSSRSSLEGNWGSVSVLSTASIDAGNLQLTEKSKVNAGKSNAATSDVYEPPSFMTLVETESKDKKPESSEVQDSQKQPNSEVSQAGWFPTMAKVSNESEGRKRNEEAIAKVTNWSTGKQSMPLKNLMGEAKSPGGTKPEPVVQKHEAIVNPPVNDDVSSPPKLIGEDGKKGRKKVRGISSWVPFTCCSSVNVVN